MKWLVLIAAALAASPTSAAPQDAEAIYQQRCMDCHAKPAWRKPSRDEIASLSADVLVDVLTTGVMKAQAEGLSPVQVRALAVHLSRKPMVLDATLARPGASACKSRTPALAMKEGDWNGWGQDLANSRFQPQPGLSAADVPRLKLKWAHEYPGRYAHGQPTIVGSRVFVTSTTGRVSALDAASGCEIWAYEAGVGVDSAVVVADLGAGAPTRLVAFFGDLKAQAHAVDAETGRALWKTHLDEHPWARVTGAPVVFEGRVYLPVASSESSVASLAMPPFYICCSFRGSVVALDGKTGLRLWKTHTIDRPAALFKNAPGQERLGPAGAAVWSSPTLDAKRRLLYVGSGHLYSEVADVGGDAIHALELDTGRRAWVKQVTARDFHLDNCRPGSSGNCPAELGPGWDFGSAPILHTLEGGRQVLLAGQKSGVLYAMDPDDQGRILWQRKLGFGGPMGGMHRGSAADGLQVYAAVSDLWRADSPRPGLTALKVATGEEVWHVPTPKVACSWFIGLCRRGQPAAVTVIPGVVFSGAVDGHLRAYAAETGAIVWEHDTAKPHPVVGGGHASGGSIDGGGATVAHGAVYVTSGHADTGLGKKGNLLLAFTVDGK